MRSPHRAFPIRIRQRVNRGTFHRQVNGQGSTLAAVLLLLAPTLAVVQGLQLLRGLLASLSVYLGQVRDVDSATLAGVILLIFLTGFAAPLVRRILGPGRCQYLLAGAIALLRVAELLSPTPEVRLAVEIAGVVGWLWFLQLIAAEPAAASTTSSTQTHCSRAAIALLLGLTVDTAIIGGFATLDPGFSSALGPLIFTVALSGAHLAMICWLASRERIQVTSGGPPMWALVVGPVLALELLLFQNLARQVVLIGWSLPAAFAWLLAANLLTVWIAVTLSARAATVPRWLILVAAVILIVSAVQPDQPLWAAAVAMSGPIACGVLLIGSLSTVNGGGWGWFAASAGLVAIPLVLFGWYAHYEIDLPLPQHAIPLIAAAFVAVFAGFGSHRSATQSIRVGGQSRPIGDLRQGAVLTFVLSSLLILPLFQLAVWRAPEPRSADVDSLRVATYNIHQGFDLQGMPSLERIAEVVESERPDVIALQEVPRGWVVNGSVDALGWLEQRLRMHSAWGPAADPFWGNALLSRFPIVKVENRPMPNNDVLNLARAYLLVTIDVDGQLVQIVATHLHHVGSEARHRIPQVNELITAVDWSQPSVLLGDLNAQPHHAEIRTLGENGLSLNQPPVRTYPANRPRRQIDYVMATEDFTVLESYAVDTEASDHLPLFADLRFRGS